ncbi:MAG: pyridoxamine 5'-phosphate oxidase [Chloroflexi bacterium]|nr:MAG: pyridoxamine 5'-phosphate oxidase [Chloroflexota bacterium]
MSEPRRDRPHMPGYGIKPEPDGLQSWDRFQDRATGSRNYWVATVGDDGRPHVMPVWGLWLEGLVYFSTDPSSRKGRNLRSRPEVVVHLESGDDVVIVEGVAEPVTDPAAVARFVEAYEAKYRFRPDPGNPAHGVYAVRPRRAFSWLEQDYPSTATRWRWEG